MNVYILWQKADLLDEQDTLIAIYTKEGLEKALYGVYLDQAKKIIEEIIQQNKDCIVSNNNERTSCIEDSENLLHQLKKISDKYSGEYKRIDKKRKELLKLIDTYNKLISKNQTQIFDLQKLTDEEKIKWYLDYMNYKIEEEEVIE